MKNLFAERFKELRIQINKTQAEVAKDLNTSQSTVAKWESVDLEPSLEMLIKISLYFKVTPNELLGFEEI